MARRLLLPIFLVAATAAAAAAGPGDATPTPALRGTTASDLAAKDCARARAHHKPCVLTFGTGDTINGNGATGEGTVVDVPTFGRFDSLIRLRQDFRPEIIKAAEDL
jgi:hypothetical protein